MKSEGKSQMQKLLFMIYVVLNLNNKYLIFLEQYFW